MSKIKGFSNAVKMKYLLFVFAASVLAALPTRVYQLLALVDTENGFYTSSDVTVPVLYTALVVFAGLFLVLSFISKEVPSPELPEGKNRVLGIASAIMAAGLAFDMVSLARDTIPGGTGNAAIFFSLLKSNLTETVGFAGVLRFFFAFFGIIYFLVFAISHLNGRASYKEFKLLALSPLCWSMTMLVARLTQAISFVKVSELLFEIFMCVFLMLFFITFARISSGVYTEDSMWGVYGYGLSGALLGAVVTIPRIVMMFVGVEPVQGYEFNFAHLATLIFVVAYIFASLGVGFKGAVKSKMAATDVALPEDDEVVEKKDEGFKISLDFTIPDSEAEETTEESVETAVVDVIVDVVAEDEEATQETAEAAETDETVEEIVATSEVTVEESAEEATEEAEESTEEAVEETVEETSEEATAEEEYDPEKPISLADLRKRKDK